MLIHEYQKLLSINQQINQLQSETITYSEDAKKLFELLNRYTPEQIQSLKIPISQLIDKYNAKKIIPKTQKNKEKKSAIEQFKQLLKSKVKE